MPTWTTPKTDWEGTDYFTAADWLRIVGNIEYICDVLSYSFTPYINVTDGETLLTSEDRNYITRAIDGLYIDTNASWNRGYVAPRVDYGSAWNSKDLNIIESMLRDIKAQIDGDLPQNDFYRAGEEFCCGDTFSVGLL